MPRYALRVTPSTRGAMEAQGMPIAGSIALALIVAAGVVFVLRARASELRVCRDVLRGLIDGSPSIGRSIDWEHLRALGVDVGATYRQLPNERERAGYRQAFIEQFANGFRRASGVADGFRAWRVQRRADAAVVVAADYEAKHRTLLMSVSSARSQKVEKMEWVSK